MRHAQDYISKYFFLHYGEKGCHREQLMLIILSSMREAEVSDGSLFNSFDKNNAHDIRSVSTYFKSLLENSVSKEDGVSGYEELLKVFVKLFQMDLETWWKWKAGSLPLIYYVLGGSDFISNCEELMPVIFMRCLDQETTRDPWYIRRLMAMIAMVTAHLDEKDNQGFQNQGAKVSLARGVARKCYSEEPNILHTELVLMQPNWFSFLVSKQIMLLEDASRSKLASLGDLVRMFQGLNVREKQRGLICENMIQKCFSVTHTHVLLRAHWFFSTQTEGKRFETFLGMKQLLPSKKEQKKVVEFRNGLKISVSQQLRDLKTLRKFCTGTETKQPESTSLRFLLFKMDREEDKGWHPGLGE